MRVVGRPIPVAHRGASREEGRRRFDLSLAGPVVAVFGALAGARSLNEMAVGAWGAGGPDVLHVCGERDFESLRPRVDRPGYVLLAQTDHFGEALAAADLAVSRAGGTVWELAAAGTPAILVPYPYATADHQTLNARHFERGGGAVVVPDAEVDRVPTLVDELLRDPARLAGMREAMLALARPDAADDDRRRARRPRPGSGDDVVVSHHKPLDGRRLYFVGIGGSGLSAYANIARALGRRGARLGRAGDDLHRDARRRSRSISAASRVRPTASRSSSRPAHLGRVDGHAAGGRSSPSSSPRSRRSS